MIIIILQIACVFMAGMIAGSLVMDLRIYFMYKKATGKDLFDEIKKGKK